MISRRLAAALIAAPAALSLAACASSTTDGSGGGGPTGSSSASSATSSAPSSSSAPTGAASSGSSSMPQDAKGLYALMIEGQKKTKTARIEIDASTAGQTLKAVGDEKLDNGKVTAMNFVESLPGGAGKIQFFVVG